MTKTFEQHLAEMGITPQQAEDYMMLARHRALWKPHKPTSVEAALELIRKTIKQGENHD